MNGCSAGSSLVLLTAGGAYFPALTMRMAFLTLRSVHEHGSWMARASSDNACCALRLTARAALTARAGSTQHRSACPAPVPAKAGQGLSPLPEWVRKQVSALAHCACCGSLALAPALARDRLTALLLLTATAAAPPPSAPAPVLTSLTKRHRLRDRLELLPFFTAPESRGRNSYPRALLLPLLLPLLLRGKGTMGRDLASQ
jgi:hypothetical protein